MFTRAANTQYKERSEIAKTKQNKNRKGLKCRRKRFRRQRYKELRCRGGQESWNKGVRVRIEKRVDEVKIWAGNNLVMTVGIWKLLVKYTAV